MGGSCVSDFNHRSAPITDAFETILDGNEIEIGGLLAELLESLRLHLDLEIGFISEFVDGQRRFLHVSSVSDPPLIAEGDDDPLDETLCQRVVNGEAPSLIPDATLHQSSRDLAVIQALDIKTHVSVPILLSNGEVFGTLCCFGRDLNPDLDERNVAFMSVLADLIAMLLQRGRKEKRRIRQKRERLNSVLESGALEMVWQPVVDTASAQPVAVEALARFRVEPYRPPNEWFSDAAELDMAVDLERRAFAKGAEILKYLPDGIPVTCNLSGKTLLDPVFREFLHARDLSRIVLELTEHDVIDDYDELMDVLREFRADGMRLAVDDFGAGYASFRHILNLEPNIIKLDMSLIRGIDSNAKAQSVVRALLAFADETSDRVVAEGVETEEELSTLRCLGVRSAQGYFFHKPLSREELLSLFAMAV